MSSTEQISPFHASLAAFEIRFESELASRWQALEYEAHSALVRASPTEKHFVLNRFFEDAKEAVSSVVHEYFQKLLRVAATQRRHLGSDSPLAWTKGQVMRQVCDFLGLDQEFDENSQPREDSRVLAATARLALEVGWWDEAIPGDFVLPGWVASRWALSQVLVPASFRRRDEVESLPPLSRAETLTWVKYKEFWISRRLERQIENDEWDGVIDGGIIDVSVLDAFGTVDEGPDRTESKLRETDPSNSFIREATTWAISFGKEICRLKTMIGLDYIAVLLEKPLTPVRALELQSMAGGLPVAARPTAERVAKSLEVNEDYGYAARTDFSRDEVLDGTARRKMERTLEELETDIAHRLTIGDKQTANELQERHSEIESYLENSQNIHGRSRVFPGENEKARQAVTQALTRAYRQIRAQAPETARHLEDQIERGSEFMYRDDTTRWQILRKP